MTPAPVARLVQWLGRLTARRGATSAGYRFTDRVRAVLQRAQGEAGGRDHDYVGTEHVLLALLAAPDDPATRAIRGVGGDPAAIRRTSRRCWSV